MNDYYWLGAVIGFGASLVGLLEYVRGRVSKEIKHSQEHEQIIAMLKPIKETSIQLADVLGHPDDSGFGVGDVSRELEEIQKKLEDIDKRLEELLQRNEY